MILAMKEYPVGHAFYKSKGLEHVEGKIPAALKKRYQKIADEKHNGSLLAAISAVLIKHAPKG